MASISSYSNATPTDGDQLLGTDATDGTTKNFLLTALRNYFVGLCNLGSSYSNDQVIITSSTGANATINEADGSNAGVMTVDHHNKLDGIASGAQVNVGTDLGALHAPTTVGVISSTGNATTITQSVAGGNAGVMSGADKAKLDAIEAGATADQTGAEIVSAIDAQLGSSTWQSGGGGGGTGGGDQGLAWGFGGSTTTQLQTFSLVTNTTSIASGKPLDVTEVASKDGAGNDEQVCTFGGTPTGSRTSAHNKLQRFIYATEVTQTRGVDSSHTAITQTCCGTDFNSAFRAGGNRETANVTNIDVNTCARALFATDTDASSHGTLSTSRRSGEGADNQADGFFYLCGPLSGGGFNSGVFKIDYSSATTHSEVGSTTAGSYPHTTDENGTGELVFVGGRPSGFIDDIHTYNVANDTTADTAQSWSFNLSAGGGEGSVSTSEQHFIPGRGATNTDVGLLTRATKTKASDFGSLVANGTSPMWTRT